jgi:hypothetical protein
MFEAGAILAITGHGRDVAGHVHICGNIIRMGHPQQRSLPTITAISRAGITVTGEKHTGIDNR